jgi:hypothetical protein
MAMANVCHILRALFKVSTLDTSFITLIIQHMLSKSPWVTVVMASYDVDFRVFPTFPVVGALCALPKEANARRGENAALAPFTVLQQQLQCAVDNFWSPP